MRCKYLLVLFSILFFISFTSALGVVVRPLTAGGALQPTATFNYQFNFTTDAACTNIVKSFIGDITLDLAGVGFAELDISGMSPNPSHMCEYKAGSLRIVHNLTDLPIRDLFAREGNFSGNVSSDSWFRGLYNWITGDSYNSFDGHTLTFNQTHLNSTMDTRFINTNGDILSGNMDAGGNNLTNIGTINATDYFGITANEVGSGTFPGAVYTMNGLLVYTDTLGNTHVLNADGTQINRARNNLLLTNINYSYSTNATGLYLNLIQSESLTIRFVLEEGQNNLGTNNVSILLNNGSDSNPIYNYVYIYNSSNPTVSISPTGLNKDDLSHVTLFEARVGSVNATDFTVYGAINYDSTVESFYSQTLDRFTHDGILYHEGFNISINVSDVSISGGEIYFKNKPRDIAGNINLNTSAYYINGSGQYVKFNNLSDITTYGDTGNIFTPNKKVNLIWGLTIQDGTAMLIVLIQGEPSTEYKNTAQALADEFNKVEYGPTDHLLTHIYLPLAQTVMDTSTNELQDLTGVGNYYLDLRGAITGAGGGITGVPITDHSDLDLLECIESGHTNIFCLNQSNTISGNQNFTGNITINEFLFLNGAVSINDVSANKLWDGLLNIDTTQESENNLIFIIGANGSTGVNMPHFWIQGGGGGQASGISRSFMIVNEVISLQNTTNITDCGIVQDLLGFDPAFRVDCNTSTTGADLIVGDDLIVGGDVRVTDEEGEMHSLNRVLQRLDEMFNNIIFNKLDLEINLANLSISDADNRDNLAVLLNGSASELGKRNDSVVLNTGTDISPTSNYVSYQNESNPILTVSASEPDVDHADVAKVIVGSTTDRIYLLDDTTAHGENLVDHLYDTLGDAGAKYRDGLVIDASETNINISTGDVRIRLSPITYTNGVDSSKSFFYVNSTGNYLEGTSPDNFTQYADGSLITSNREFSIVWTVCPKLNSSQAMLLYAVLPDKPSTEYNSIQQAITDDEGVSNFFPPVTDLKQACVPVARTVHSQSGTNDFEIVVGTQRFIDVRGEVTLSAGSAPSPSITKLSQLEIDANLNMAGLNITNVDSITVNQNVFATTIGGLAQLVSNIYTSNTNSTNIVSEDIKQNGFQVLDADDEANLNVNDTNRLGGLLASAYALLSGGNTFTGTQDFDGGWTGGGLTISGGNLYAQTVYVYNISSLAVSEMNINGSFIPSLNNMWALGSTEFKWKHLFLDGEIKMPNGNISSNATSLFYNNGTKIFDLTKGGGVPEGALVQFDGSCPTGWIDADGTSGTPNLVNITIDGQTVLRKQYLGNGTDFTVTAAGWTTLSAKGIPYKTSDGAWRLRFNIIGSLGSTANPTVVISGVTFAFTQSVTTSKDGAAAGEYADAVTGTGNVVGVGAAASIGWRFSGDVELESKPTWADADSTLKYCMKTAEDTAESTSLLTRIGNLIQLNNATNNVNIQSNLTVQGNLTVNGNFVGLKQYVANSSEGSGDFNITDTNWVTTRGVAIPYQTTDGAWRMKFNIEGTFSSTSSPSADISGVTFKTGVRQAYSASGGTVVDWGYGFILGGTNTISSNMGVAQTSGFFSGDVELDSKPTWAN